MIISTIIQTACFITIVFELLDIYKFLHGCKKVRCTVVSSKKIVKRKHGFLVDEYYKTRVSFKNNSETAKAVLRTSTFCPNGQQINCYYHTDKHIIFRRRDLRKNIKSSSLILLSICVLFVVLNSVFSLAVIGKIILDNIITIFTWGLTAVFFIIGTSLIVYAIYAIKSYKDKDIIKITAVVEDVIMKTTRDNENRQYSYYPIYSYQYNGIQHTVRSKTKYPAPPAKGSRKTVFLNKRKSSIVEYSEAGKSLTEGICFYLIAACFIAVKWFLITPLL